MTELYSIQLVLCSEHAQQIEKRYEDYLKLEKETNKYCDLCQSEKLRKSLLD